jgi:hypothetical protein
MRRWHLRFALLLTVAGCTDAQFAAVHVETPGIANTDRALQESIAKVNRAMQELGGAGAASREPTTPDPYVPAELQRPVSLAMTGSLDQAVKALAERAGYSFKTNATAQTPLVTITLTGETMTLLELFRSVGTQAGSRADVVVNADQHQVMVQYHA